MHRKIPVAQLPSFASNPTPRVRRPEAKTNNQESMRIIRAHIQGHETPFSVKLPWSTVREMRWARMVGPRRWMVALRTCIPMVGDASDRFMAVSTTRSGTDTGSVKLERFSHPGLEFCKSRPGPRGESVYPVPRQDLDGLNSRAEKCRLRREWLRRNTHQDEASMAPKANRPTGGHNAESRESQSSRQEAYWITAKARRPS